MSYHVDKYGNITKKKKQEEKQPSYRVDRNGGITVVKADTAPVRETVTPKRTWFEAGRFDDGYQFGDVTRTVAESAVDLASNVAGGALEIGEKFVDTGAYLVGGAANIIGKDEFAQDTKRFIAGDLYDGVGIAKNILTLGTGAELEGSVFGDKSDSVAQSVGQQLGTRALQLVGVPWQLTTGVNAFGGEVESAFKDDATYGQAGLSGVIAAGTEIVSEMLFKGSGLGETGLIDVSGISKGIANATVKRLVDFGIDMTTEGFEEIFSEVISNVASGLYREEDIWTRLASKDALEGYLDAFIGGAVSSGVMNFGKVRDSQKKGTDYNTGLTATEQKVADAEIQKRIEEQEKNGKKVTRKQRAAIEEEVLRDLEKGNIKVGDIERYLGGGAYDAWKQTKAKEDSIVKEYNKLDKLSVRTPQQQARYEALAKQVEEINNDPASERLKAQLSEDVFGRAKDGLLNRSYVEKAKRGQKFQADLSKYNYAEQKVIKKIIDSGILNNTTRTHEFVDLLVRISVDKGVPIDVTNNERLKNSGFAVEGKTVNGYLTKDGITVNINSSKALNSVVGHEITHVLEGTELYDVLREAVYKYAQTREGKAAFDKRLKAVQEMYKNMDADPDAELTADLVGDYLFTDAEFINHLSVNHRNIFEKIFAEIKYMLKIATAGSKEARELERVKKAFEEAYRKTTAMPNEVRAKMDGAKTTETKAETKAEAVEETQVEEVAETEVEAEAETEVETEIEAPVMEDTQAEVVETQEDIAPVAETASEVAMDSSADGLVAALEGYGIDMANAPESFLKKVEQNKSFFGDKAFMDKFQEAMSAMSEAEARNNLAPSLTGETYAFDKYAWAEGAMDRAFSAYIDSLSTKPKKKGLFGKTKYSLSSIANSFFGDENMSAVEFEQADYTQTQGYKDYVEECLNNYRQSRGDAFNEAVARKEIEDSIAGIVDVALAAKRAGYDIFDDATKRSTKDSKKRLLFSSLEPNSDYFTSNDISTICDKRKNFAEIYDDIVKAEEKKGVPAGKRFFANVDNYFYLHKLMADKGLTQPCRQCYVESMRKNLAPMANAFLRLVKETNPNNTANDQLFHVKGKSKGQPKTNNTELRQRVLEVLADYGMSVNDLSVETLTTEDGLAQLKITAPLVYEAFNSFYGQSKPKMPKAATPFRFGELTALLTDEKGRIKPKLIEKINSTGGFRLQSYSDFQIQNYTDVLQVIFEAGTLGLNGHAYTKVPAFLDATEGTNLKRNISIFMYKDGSEWKLDRNDSFPYALDQIYQIVNADTTGNTSIIAVSQNDDMSAWIMANDYVGYGIPFHKSGMKMGTVRDTDVVTEDGRIVKGYSGTKDHTKQQTEVWAKTTADHKAMTKVKKGISIYDFWDFANADNLPKNELIEKNVKAYIDACEEAGYLPRFRDYVMNNGKVLNSVLEYSKKMGFVSESATVEDISFEYKGYRIPYGYYKFLGDFGMFTPDGMAAPQQPLSLNNYDFAKAAKFFADAESLRRTEILQQFSNGPEREKYRQSDLTAGELADIVKQKRSEIAESVAGKSGSAQYSLSEQENAYQYNLDNGNMELAEMNVEEYANLALPDSKIRGKDGRLVPVYHGTKEMFWEFDTSKKGGVNGTAEGFGIYLSDDPEVTQVYGDRQIKMFANITKPATSTKKTIPQRTLIKLIEDTCKREAQRMVADGEYDNVNDALRDTWISNYVYTYDMSMAQAYREVANTFLQQNSSDMDIVQEVMFAMAIRDYGTAMEFYRTSLTPITGFDGFATQWEQADGKKSNIYLAFDSSQLKSADAVTKDDAGNVIPLSERFNTDKKDIRYSLSEADTIDDAISSIYNYDTAVKDDGSPLARVVVDSNVDHFVSLLEKGYYDDVVKTIAKHTGKTEREVWDAFSGLLMKNEGIAKIDGKTYINVHELSEENLRKAFELGGLAAPSIGIVDVDSPNTHFGKISLIFPDIFNPETVPTHYGDSYSSNFPAVGRFTNNTMLEDALTYGFDGMEYSGILSTEEMYDLIQDLEQVYFYDSDQRTSHMIRDDGFSSAREFAHDYNIKSIPGLRKLYDGLKGQYDSYEHFLEDFADKVFTEKRIHKDNTAPEYSWDNRRDNFMSYDIDNAVQDMTARGDKDFNLALGERVANYDELLSSGMRARLKSKGTNFYEAKPQRAVYIGEATYAVVPEDTSADVIDMLESEGVRVVKYSPKEGYTGVADGKAEAIKGILESDTTGIRYSMSNEGEEHPVYGSYNVHGEDVALEEIAPTQEAVAPTQETAVEAQGDIAPVAGEMFPDDNVPESDEEFNARMASITEADAPPEMAEQRYNIEQTDVIPLTKKVADDIRRNVREKLALSNKHMADVREIVERFSQSRFPSREKLFQVLKERFGTYTESYSDDSVKEAKSYLRKYKLYVDDFIKSEIADYGNLKKSNRYKLRFSDEGTPVDVVYQELNSMYPGLFPDDIIAPTDQFLQIVDVVNMDSTTEVEIPLDDSAIYDVADSIIRSVNEYKQVQREKQANQMSREAFNSLMENADQYAPPAEDIAPVAQPTAETAPVAPTTEQTPAGEMTVDQQVDAKIESLKTEVKNLRALRTQASEQFDKDIMGLTELYHSKQNKNTMAANDILQRIERLKRLQKNVDDTYAKRIATLEERVYKASTKEFRTAEHRKSKTAEYTALMEELAGDTSTWVDKKLGLSYKLNTLRRNLRDVVRDANGNRDIERADAIYDELQGNYNRHEAMLKRESNQIKKPYADMQINSAEDMYIQMLGELRHNPDTTLTKEVVDEFYEKNKKKIDTAKVDRAIEEARKTYDELLERVNAVLREQGMKEIPYRKGYFPHFTDEKQGFLSKLFNWQSKNYEIPTSIAGVTEQFNPNRSWQSFNKERTSDITDYSFTKGMDSYVHGALDWIHHIEDIQKRRAFENHIRYIHSEQGVKDRIDKIRNSDEYDAEEMQEQIDLVYAEANNPLNNFVVDLRAGTNTLAAKKSSLDRGMEELVNRGVYNTMTNLSNRVSANMVVGSFSSALTNFIPITQSWGQVSPISSLRAMADTIRSAVYDDGMVNKSDFLTNRLRGEESLHKTGWDKVGEKVSFLMEGIDSFTSQTVWRSKYLENISKGMSENEAIRDADQFAENVIAGRSRGNLPTIFDSKNPLVKTLTAFQLEVANQYGYMLKDMPQDMRNESLGKLVKGYATMFIGANAYNALYSSLVGRDAAFDPIGIIGSLLSDLGIGGDDDEEKEPEEVILNFAEDVAQEIPFIGGLLGGGRVPISAALPYDSAVEMFTGTVKDVADEDWGNLTKEWLKPIYYLAMPMGGGQLKKTVEGLSMFSDDHPVSGSYTASGDLRYPVEKTPWNVIQAGMFGQYANDNARYYFDNDIAPLSPKQTQEYIDVDIPIRDYWDYRNGLKGKTTLGEKVAYISTLDLPIAKQNILVNNLTDRKEPIDMTDYNEYSDWGEFDYAKKYPDKYAFLKANGITAAQYEAFDKDTKEAYNWAYQNPEKFLVSKVVAGDVVTYRSYTSGLSDIKADKDEDGKSVSGSRKEKVISYINSLPIDYGPAIILFKSEYPSDDTYNNDIVAYVESQDLTFEEKTMILTELDFTVLPDGTVQWD